MRRCLFMVVVIGLVGAVLYHQRPDIERYLRIKEM
ncbi:MAG: hypothetical protein JWL73_1125 [Actinomycetia bacterium]|nr:hypothetical protein [Actinomycetes bacterium]